MYTVLVSDKLSEKGLAILRDCTQLKVDVKTGLKPEELKSIIKKYDALIVRSSTKVTKEIIDASNLKVIGRAGVGLDNVDLKAATNKGIIVMNSPSGNTLSTAEHAMSLMLGLSRNIAIADASMKAGKWDRSQFQGTELYNKTLGIIGLGRIGQAVAKRAASFGMKVISYDPFLVKDVADTLGVEIVDLKQLFKDSDYITCHIPLTEETRNLISAKQIELMKNTVRIINCSRGGVVNEADCAKALEDGRIAGIALDVFEKEPPDELALRKFDKALLTPHLGASTQEAQVNVAVEIAEQVRDALLGVGFRNAANFPSVDTETQKALQPVFDLSEKLGSIAAQLIDGRIEKVDITYYGDLARFDTTPLTMCVLKGLLAPVLQDTVNFINALALAKERSIKVKEEKSSEQVDFLNLITIDVTTQKNQKLSIAGSLFTKKNPRIVRINEFHVEAIPEGNMVVIDNVDKAGIIGNLGTLLGKHNINVAGMTFGRLKKGGKAISVFNVDSIISPQLLEKIKKIPHIKGARAIKL